MVETATETQTRSTTAEPALNDGPLVPLPQQETLAPLGCPQDASTPTPEPGPLSEAEKERRAEYLAVRDRLDTLKANQLTALDKAILGFSTGIPTTILALVKMVQLKDYVWKDTWVFQVGFLCFFVALLSTLISYRCSANTIQEMIDRWDAIYQGRPDDDREAGTDLPKIVNYISLIAFVLGWVWTAIFVVLNT